MLALGIDLGTSFVKVSVYDATRFICIASAQFPENETTIISKAKNWAEQDPMVWWNNVKQAILLLNAQEKYNPKDIKTIGIAYQMHGLVCVDEENNVLRDAIIWCDSRAVEIGNKAFKEIGESYCLNNLLNSPGNFTASKLAWVKQNEPNIFTKINKIMLPGDFIAMKLTGQISTTVSALSEGVFWDFKKNKVSDVLMDYFGFKTNIIPEIKNSFDNHGHLTDEIAIELNLKEGITVTYKAGDQPNNALSLNVFKNGEVAATAGTSGVIYAVSDELFVDAASSVNSFAHVNHFTENNSIGILMCINGTGILYKYIKNIFSADLTYPELNAITESVPIGSEGLIILPFGNGAERIMKNKSIGAHILNLNFNIHTTAHISRAALEGIAFAFHYGIKIMEQNGLKLNVVKAPKANLFLSKVFIDAFVNTTGLAVELYECDGSVGAAIGASVGASFYKNTDEAFAQQNPLETIKPNKESRYPDLYKKWEHELLKFL